MGSIELNQMAVIQVGDLYEIDKGIESAVGRAGDENLHWYYFGNDYTIGKVVEEIKDLKEHYGKVIAVLGYGEGGLNISNE